jgi:hypothetical protein
MANIIKILRSLTSGNRPAGAHQYGEPYVNFADNQFGVMNSSNVAQDLIGVPIFSTGATYINGQTVNYQGQLYISKFAVSPGAWNPAQWSLVVAQKDMTAMRGYIDGLIISTAGGSTTLTVAPGVATDSNVVDIMKLTSSISKTTSAWAVGTGNGGLDTGAIVINTWYHVYLIKRTDTGVVDIVFSQSTLGPNLPPNYTLWRRIGSLLTNGAAQWTLFSQNGDEFLWSVPFGDAVSVAVGTAGIIQPLKVPSGFIVTALFNSLMISNTVGTLVLFHSLTQSNQTANTPLGNFHLYISVANLADAGQFAIRTNTSSQIRMVSNATAATCTVSIATQGWFDRRGKDT